MLGGLLANDVAALRPGEGQWAAALTAKGRVLALCRVLRDEDGFLLDTDAAALPGFLGMLRKYVNPRLATIADATAETRCLGVHGPDAAEALVRHVGGSRDALLALSPLGHRTVIGPSGPLRVVRNAALATPGFDLIGARQMVDAVAAALEAEGWAFATAEQLESERIEAGVPRWGVDMTEETIAQEAALDDLGALSFSKGCYTGQEVVARIHFRGHVNRLLRRLRSDLPLSTGAVVRDAAGAEVGEVRSQVATGPGGPTAIAMVRREVPVGATVEVLTADGARAARVEALTRAPSGTSGDTARESTG